MKCTFRHLPPFPSIAWDNISGEPPGGVAHGAKPLNQMWHETDTRGFVPHSKLSVLGSIFDGPGTLMSAPDPVKLRNDFWYLLGSVLGSVSTPKVSVLLKTSFENQ